jgi:DNA-binding transcriptional ArsR family regulator
MPDGAWSFLSRHGMAMVEVARRPDIRLRELAAEIGVTPRATQTIVGDLAEAGFVERRREGRRNHYRVRGDRTIPDRSAADHEVSDLLGALVSGPRITRPSGGHRHALVLACSDHRYQEPLRDLLAAEGLLAQAEVVLWPGGAASLTGPEGSFLLEVMTVAVDAEPPNRVVLVAHQDCHVRLAFDRGSGGRLSRLIEVRSRRRRSIELVEAAFGVRPDTWYLTRAGARRVGQGHAITSGDETRVRAGAGGGR